MIVIGRIFIGVGGARILARKYIAGYIPDHEKPRVASLFVCSTVIGMTLGPATSVFLSEI